MTQSFALGQSVQTAHQFAAQDAYHNVNQLKQLGAMSANDAEMALDKVSNQFEALLVQQMLKSMRQANQIWSEDSLFSSRTVNFYQQMMDDQLSVELSQDGALGFADAVSRQLVSLRNEHSRSSDTPESAVSTGGFSIEGLRRNARLSVPVSSASLPQQSAVDVQSDKVVSSSGYTSLMMDTPEAFVASLLPYSREAADRLGVPVEKIIAQAALETGWGKHVMQNPDGSSSYNLFGIKADSRWQGDTVTKATQEFMGGRELTVNASFRSYESLQHAFDDYVAFLQGNPRYEQVINSSLDFAASLQQAGYATDPAYAKKIDGIAIQLNNVERFEVVR